MVLRYASCDPAAAAFTAGGSSAAPWLVSGVVVSAMIASSPSIPPANLDMLFLLVMDMTFTLWMIQESPRG